MNTAQRVIEAAENYVRLLDDLDHAAAELEQLADDTEESHTTDGLWPDDPELDGARTTVYRCRDLAAGLRHMLWKAGL